MPVHCQGSCGAAGLQGAQPCHWLLWRREAPSPQGGLVGCKRHRSQLSWWCGYKWKENWALTSKGLPDLSPGAGLIVTQCLKKPWSVQIVYIFLYIPIYIYNLYKHTMKESQGLRLARRAALFVLASFFPFLFFFLTFIQTSLFCSFAFIEYYHRGKQYCYSTRTIWSWV